MSRAWAVTAAWVFSDGAFREGWALRIGPDGDLEAVGEAAAVTEGASEVLHLDGHALIPGLVNAHSHCWQVLLRGVREDPADFQDWVARQLYPIVDTLDLPLFAAAARLAFTQMVLNGVTTCGEFHYVHRGPGGSEVDDAYDLAVLDAADAVGLRVALARTMYDLGTRPGQKRFQETPDEAVAATRRLAAEAARRPRATVLPAPHSLHGASREMLVAAGALADELDTRFHIHLAEQQVDHQHSQQTYGATPLRALEQLGLLGPRTTLVHGIWMDEAEVRDLGAAGGALVYNPWTNMLLGDGVAPLPTYLAAGVPVGLGTDANSSPCLLTELRAAEYLQRIQGLRMNVLPAAMPGGAPLLDLATRGGAEALGLPVGALEPGRRADVVALRLDAPSLAPGSGMGPDQLLFGLTHGCQPREAVDKVWVGGQLMVDGGQPTRLDLSELCREVGALSRAAFGSPG